MKKRKFFTAGIAVLFTALLAFVLFLGTPPARSASADSYDYATAGAYDYTIENYDVEIELSNKRVATVKETITAYLYGYDSHGIIRDFPLHDKFRYRNIRVACDNADFSPYVKTEDGFLSYYLRGNRLAKGERRTYTLTYELIGSPLKSEGYFSLDIIGYGGQASIKAATAKISVPDGLTGYEVFSGYKGITWNWREVEHAQEGNVVTLSAPNGLDHGFGITLDLQFEAGVLSTETDYSILWAVLLGIAVFMIAVAVKLLFCRQRPLVRSVNLTAPDEMDPLLMGKLIDNKVDGEDMGALVFWLAAEGYLTIDFSEDKKNPTLYKSEKHLSSHLPRYVREFYKGLFNGRESVKVSALTNSFYSTSDSVKRLVNAEATNMYDKKKSYGLLALCGVIAFLLLAGFSFFYPLATVNSGYFYFLMLIGVPFAFFASAFGSNIAMQRAFKWKKPLLVLSMLGGLAVGILIGLFTSIFACAAFGFWTKFVLVLFAAAAGTVSGTFLVRTKEYNDTLGHILGFKQFILVTERDKIEFMLKENPDLYYTVLPYAQVLGVTDAWTNKFKGLDMSAPRYTSYSAGDFVFDCMIWNSLSRGFSQSFSHAAVSRPSSSGGKSGGFGKGFGGGFGGGGFGGGGTRGC